MVALAAAVAFHALAQALVLGASALGLGVGAPAARAILLASAAGAFLFARRFRAARAEGPGERGPEAPFAVAVAAALAVIWCAWLWGQAWVLAWLREPLDWDGLYYHLPALNGWVAAGRVAWLADVPDLPFANGYPMGAEALAYLVRMATGTSRLVDGVNLLYWPLAALACASLAGSLGARGAWRTLAGALVFVAPVYVSQSVTCYTDPAFVSCAMAALAALARLRDDAARDRWRTALLLGAAVGLTAGVKGAGAPYALVLAVAAGWALARPRDGRAWRRVASRLAVVAAAALTVGGYWYVRNVVHTGNPVYPMQVRAGAFELFAGYDAVAMQDANLPPWLQRVPSPLRMPYAWLQTDAPIVGYAPIGGMGFAWLLGGLPAVVAAWALRRRLWPPDSTPRRALVLLTATAAVLLAVQVAPWWGRFTVWLHGPGLACLVAVAGLGGARAGRVARGALLAWVAAVGAVGAWEAQTALAHAWGEGRRPHAERPGELFLSSLEWIAPGLPDSTGGPDGFVAARRIARSRWERTGTLLGGALAQPLGRREVICLPDAPGDDDVARLRRDAVSWVIWDVAAAGPPPAGLRAAARDTFAYRVGDDADFRFLFLRLGD